MFLQKKMAYRMKNEMAAKQFTVEELSQHLGIAKSSTQDYLREKGNPRADTIELIYENLGLSMEVFLHSEESPSYEEAKPDFSSLLGKMESICGLIPSNTRYGDLFRASVGTSAQIVDQNDVPRYTATGAEPWTAEALRAAETGPVDLPGGKRLHSQLIRGGRVLWTEDISSLLALQETLRERQEELKERNEFLEMEYEQERQYQLPDLSHEQAVLRHSTGHHEFQTRCCVRSPASSMFVNLRVYLEISKKRWYTVRHN